MVLLAGRVGTGGISLLMGLWKIGCLAVMKRGESVLVSRNEREVAVNGYEMKGREGKRKKEREERGSECEWIDNEGKKGQEKGKGRE